MSPVAITKFYESQFERYEKIMVVFTVNEIHGFEDNEKGEFWDIHIYV